MNLNGWRPGQQPRPRIQTIAQRTPAVAPTKKSWRSQAQSFYPLDRRSVTGPKRSTQDTEEKLKNSIAASPSRSRAWRLRASSAHSREAESDSFLACAAKRKQRLSAASTRRCTPSLSSALLGYLSAGCSVRCCFFSDLTNFENNTWFPDRTQSRIFARNRIDFKSIHKKKSI